MNLEGLSLQVRRSPGLILKKIYSPLLTVSVNQFTVLSGSASNTVAIPGPPGPAGPAGPAGPPGLSGKSF